MMIRVVLPITAVVTAIFALVFHDAALKMFMIAGYGLLGIVGALAIGIGFFGSWILAEKVRMIRARRIDAEKQAHVMTITDNGETWVRDTDKKATWRNLTGSPTLYVNGVQSQPQEWELELYRLKLAVMAQTRAAAQVIPGTAQLLPPAAPVDLLMALDAVQRGLIVGASGSGKTTLLQWLVNRRRQVSKVVVIDPHGWPDKWPGCYVVGAGRNYAEINTGLAGLLRIMDDRYNEIGQGIRAENSHPPLTILIDEWRAIVANLGKSAAETIKALLTESRKAAFTVFVVSHSDRAKPLGLEGEYDLKDGFALVRLSIAGGQRQATLDTGNGPQPATLPGPLPPNFSHYAPPDFELDLTPETDPIETEVLELHAQGLSRAEICRRVFGNVGGKQYQAIDAILGK